ncbi:hypothetical protein M153_15780001005 [Pseudoloma neurophilia]|uniref:Uncharacterized protein n=1 Tax=Pseudoloma neurophilia TaxID=146866 RepID=A0A0R0LUI9_9MICR|nr:hypothetical protein M153_15780001005 [Pseudoloma neurophilia]
MDDIDQRRTHFERITMDNCTCKPYNVNDTKGNHLMNPELTCDITCKKNKTVKQECYCFESEMFQNGEKSCNSDHYLSLEKLKTLTTGDLKSKNIIQNCIDGGDGIEEINLYFDNTVKNGTLLPNSILQKMIKRKKTITFFYILINYIFQSIFFKI